MVQEGQIVLFAFPQTDQVAGKGRRLFFCGYPSQ